VYEHVQMTERISLQKHWLLYVFLILNECKGATCFQSVGKLTELVHDFVIYDFDYICKPPPVIILCYFLRDSEK